MRTILGIGAPRAKELAQPGQGLEDVGIGLRIGVERDVHLAAVELDVLPLGQGHPILVPAPNPGERNRDVPLAYGGIGLTGAFGNYQGLLRVPQSLADYGVGVQDLPVAGTRLILNAFALTICPRVIRAILVRADVAEHVVEGNKKAWRQRLVGLEAQTQELLWIDHSPVSPTLDHLRCYSRLLEQ